MPSESQKVTNCTMLQLLLGYCPTVSVSAVKYGTWSHDTRDYLTWAVKLLNAYLRNVNANHFTPLLPLELS